jgi:hypothetical protein
MVAVPVDIPVTKPEPETTVATEVLLLVHAPPPVASVSGVVAPVQTVVVPVMGAAARLTVTDVVAVQPAPSE